MGDSTTDADKQAQTIYEQICTTSDDRPFAFQSVLDMVRGVADWKTSNPALRALEKASPDVHLAFLNHSCEWLKAEAKEQRNFRVKSTLVDAINLSLTFAPKPFPPEMVARMLSDLREDAWTRGYFPLEPFLKELTPDQITDDMRKDLRSLHLQYAPSPTGKIEKHHIKLRELLEKLMHIPGEKELAPGRGPWSQIVFDEIATYDDITRAGWEALLEHCHSLEQAVPGKKWNHRTHDFLAALGGDDATRTLLRWLDLGPTPGQPSEARSPIEDSPYQKGIVWCLGLGRDPVSAVAIANFGIACLRKVPMLGAVSQKVGFACVQALGAMECSEAVAQLSRLRSKVKYAVARRLIEKSLRQAAELAGMTMEDLEDSCVDTFGLDGEGKIVLTIADAQATIRANEDGSVIVAWHNADGRLVKSAPSHIKKAFAQQVKSIAARAKELEQTYAAQCIRLEASLSSPRSMSFAHWRKYFIEHPLLSLLGRRLIWVFRNADGWESSGLWPKDKSSSDASIISDSSGGSVDLSRAQTVSLWHPLSSTETELQQWRDRIFALQIRQPFRQAFREFYQVTAEEKKAHLHSNRFAGIVLRQHQLSSLCRARAWDYRLMGAGFDGFNVPVKSLPQWNMHVEFYVDLPSDRDPSLMESALGEQSGSGINLFVTSDQVRFYRDRREIPVDEVPAVVYSEVMRDVDLFTSVCAVGKDEGWSDQEDRGTGVFSDRFDVTELSAMIELRASILTRVLPHSRIAKACRVEKSWLEVKGQLGTYRIALAWGGVVLSADRPRWLSIPRPLLEAVKLDLSAIPIELDYRTEMILRKAHVLADDWKIDSADFVQQLTP
jgi:hypothetical protein